VKARQAEKYLKELRHNTPPIIARIEQDRVVFDPRTVFIEQDDLLLNAIEALKGMLP
jgi:L-seryl-tRNA(Ser) seleniumtransferase